MPIGTLLAALALLLVCAAMIAGPLWGPRRPFSEPETDRQRLERRRADIVRAIRDLDFDLRMGKLDPPDHARLRAALQAEGADVLRSLAALPPPPDPDAEIEAAVAGRRARSGGRACPSCGGAVAAGDRFCPSCGARLAARGRTR